MVPGFDLKHAYVHLGKHTSWSDDDSSHTEIIVNLICKANLRSPGLWYIQGNLLPSRTPYFDPRPIL